MYNKFVLINCVLLAWATIRTNADENEYYDNEDSLRRQSYSYDPNAYNPAARDFTDRCLRLAQYSGEKACDVFNICCSEDNVLNKLNGDKCQISDPTNGCNLDIAGTKIQWAQCRAFNCTEEITTTTTTTRRPLSSSAPPTILLCSGQNGIQASNLLLLGLSFIVLLASAVVFGEQ